MDSTIERALERWVEADVLDTTTAQHIRNFEQDRAGDGGERDRGWLAEGLAYVGAALALGAAAVVLADVWDDLAAVARLGVAAVATGLLVLAAAALREHREGPAARLCTLLSTLAVVGWAATVTLGLQATLDPSADAIALSVGVASLVPAALLHRVRASWPTTLVLGGAVVTTALGAVALATPRLEPTPVGITLAGLGLAWAALGWSGHLRPRTPVEVTGLLAGGVGCQVLRFEAPLVGASVALVVALAAVAVGVSESRTAPAALGGLGVTVFAPQLVVELLGEQVGGPLALLVAGLGLVGVAVLLLRRTEVLS